MSKRKYAGIEDKSAVLAKIGENSKKRKEEIAAKEAEWAKARKEREAEKQTAAYKKQQSEEAARKKAIHEEVSKGTQKFNENQQKIASLKTPKAKSGKEASQNARAKRESKTVNTIPSLKRTNEMPSTGSISNSKPISEQDQALTARLKEELNNRIAKERAQKKYGVWESALKGAGEAISAPFSGISILADKLTGKDTFKDDSVVERNKYDTNQAKTAHSKAYGAGYLGGMMLGSYALGGGSAASGGTTTAREAYQTAKDASKAMYGLTEKQAAKEGIKAVVKTLGINSLKELPKDLVMDTLPRLAEVVDDENMTTAEKIGAIASNIGVNAAMNNVNEIPGLIGIGKDLKRSLGNIDNVAKTASKVETPNIQAQKLDAVRQGDAVKLHDLNMQGDMTSTPKMEPSDIDGVFLNDNDINDYLHSGGRYHKNRAERVARGENVIIRSLSELKDKIKTIVESPGKDVSTMQPVGLMRVSRNISDQLNTLDSNIKADDYFFQIEPNDLKHSFNEHSIPKYDTDLPMDQDDVAYALSHLNDGTVEKIEHLRGNGKRAVISVPASDGSYYTVQVISKGDGALSLKTMWKTEKNTVDTTGGSVSFKNPTSVPSSDVQSDINIANQAENVNPAKAEEAPKGHDKSLEEIDNIRGMVSLYKGKELPKTAQKNMDYLEGSLDRLEEAVKSGDTPTFREAYEDYRKAYNRVKDNLSKAGDKSFYAQREILNEDHPRNIKNLFSKEQLEQGFKNLGNEDIDIDDLPFNETMYDKYGRITYSPENAVRIEAEDTGLNKGFVNENPEIRIDAGEGSMKSGEAIPETNVNRLTEEPNRILAGTRERGFHESSRKKGAIPDDVKEAIRQQDSIDKNTYVQAKNWQTESEAIRLWDEVSTFDEAEQRLNDLMNSHNPATVPYARRLVTAYSQIGQTENAVRVMDEVSESLTKAGQYTQAAILGLAKDDPLTALRYAEKEIAKINEAGKKKFGKKWTDFVLSDEEKKLFKNINPGDEEAIRNAFETIGKRIEREYPSTFREQLKEATHIGMLLNPRTMSRNVIANIPTLAMRAAGNRIEALGQRAGHLINKDIEVNQSLLGGGKKSRALAKEVYNKPEVQALFDALDGKYNETNRLSKHIGTKQMFKGENPIDRVIDGILGGYWNKDGGLITWANSKLGAENNRSALEALRGATYKLLELGDAPFVKENFKARLASEIKVKGWKNVDEITDDAIQRALKESLEATYKDPNRLSRLLLNIKKDTGIVGEGVIPFAQTLGSIGMRSYEYSPLGGTVALGRIAKGAFDKDSEAVSRGIRELSKGLTGSAMIAAGMALYKAGVITGDYSDDPNIKEAQKRAGFKPYSIHLGDKYYTFDWMQPASVPAILGIKIAQSVENEDGIVKGLAKGGLAATDAWFDQSAFQSLAELLGGGNDNGYSDKSIAMNFVDMLLGMPQRLIPTSAGATARTIDRSYRDTYDPTSYLNNYMNQAISKIPFLSETLPQSYDAWGQPRMRANSTAGAAFQQYINPGEYSSENMNDLDTKIKAIYDEYPDKQLYPDKIDNSIDVGDFHMKLNNQQHSELSRLQGGYNSELAGAMLDDEVFNSLPNENKAKMANQVYSVARDLAYKKLYDKEPIDDNQKAIAALKKGGTEGLIEFLGQSQQLDLAGVRKTDKMYELIDQGGVEAIELYKDIYNKVPKNKNGSMQKAGLFKELATLPKDQQKLMYDIIAPNPSKEEAKAYKSGGASAAIKAYNTSYAESEKKAQEKEQKQLKAAKAAGTANKTTDIQKELASYGAEDSEDTVYYYNHAKQVFPQLTTKQYANNLYKIGGDDYKIQRPEMLAYFDKTNPSEEEAMKMWNAYGEWTTIPYVKKNGKWGAKKTK